MDDRPSFEAGTRVGRYELLAPIARGGMGTVWLARRAAGFEGDALVAIKALDQADERHERMFLDEARIASRIEHPHVAKTFELGAWEGMFYLAMEYVEGESVARIVRHLARHGARNGARNGCRMPIGVALRIAADACAGLHAAHELRDERGRPLDVIHRDASPHNVVLAASGAAKVIDFGIAKAKDRLGAETSFGEVKGTLQYLAPEQVTQPHALDRRVDVWAVGACLHEMLAGAPPFPAEGAAAMLRRLLSGAAPSPLPDDVPQPARTILARSLVHDRTRRFPTAAMMQSALERAIAQVGGGAREDVVRFVRELFGDRLAERRRAIAEAADARRTTSGTRVAVTAEVSEESAAGRARKRAVGS